ncbi:hypothetical protein [Sphingobacterium sp. BN32]|uniref:hypothetical protein n=1 Tax=Sphingobacterium sp. BN32 TaxID=3058432 RepID=UPI00265D0480|nr:hypothetical protein [Sphingobacterium sp. BN32]WKK59827.1 hypothetical protein QYC40_06195 [Sphingobacterium sp. BN32]
MRKIKNDASTKLGLILAFAALADNHNPNRPNRGSEEENDKLPNDIIPEADKRPQPENRDEDQPEIDENNPPVSPRDMDMPAESVEQIEEEEITQYPDEEYAEEEEEEDEEEEEEYSGTNPESSAKPKTFDDRDFNNDRNERRNQQDLFEQEEEEEEEDDMFDDDDYRDNPAGNSELDDRQRGKLDI